MNNAVESAKTVETATVAPADATEQDGDVQAPGGAPVAAGVAFNPEIMHNGQWSPICGHWFWHHDNNNGAATVCQTLGFSTGTQERTGTAYSSNAMPVGACNAGEALTACTGGANEWYGNLAGMNGDCTAGNTVGITVTCAGDFAEFVATQLTELVSTGSIQTVISANTLAGSALSSATVNADASTKLRQLLKAQYWRLPYPLLYQSRHPMRYQSRQQM